MSDVQPVRRHYEANRGHTDLVARIARLVDAMPPGPISASQLAGLDQFHVGGLTATTKLAALAGVRADMTILDAGSGLGGPSRYLADTYGCHVIGVDLTPSFVDASRLLTERVGLEHLVDCDVGDLLALRFPERRFDLLWTQHVAMNIRDRVALYRELRRVLKPGGRLAFHDVLAGDTGQAPHFPVPWAETQETSFLLTEAETIAAFETAGLAPQVMEDVTALALASLPNQPAPAHGFNLAMIMGPRFADMSANLVRNLREGTIRLVMGLCERTETSDARGQA